MQHIAGNARTIPPIIGSGSNTATFIPSCPAAVAAAMPAGVEP